MPTWHIREKVYSDPLLWGKWIWETRFASSLILVMNSIFKEILPSSLPSSSFPFSFLFSFSFSFTFYYSSSPQQARGHTCRRKRKQSLMGVGHATIIFHAVLYLVLILEACLCLACFSICLDWDLNPVGPIGICLALCRVYLLCNGDNPLFRGFMLPTGT